MGSTTEIEWADATWNPLFGCSKVSPGCANCYAEKFALTRMQGKREFTGLPWTPANAEANVQLRPERLDQPLRWHKPKRIFVNSLSDLFHELVPDEFILEAFDVMRRSTYNGGANAGRIRDENREGHIFQVLTKRPERMRAFVSRLRWHPDEGGLSLDGAGRQFTDPDIWLGTSVENQHWANVRIPELIQTPAVVRFLSMEPLLGPVDLEPWLWLNGASTAGPFYDALGRFRGGGGAGGQQMTAVPAGDLSWVIVGGESGRAARPMHPQWPLDLRDQCAEAGVPFLFKQWGEWHPQPIYSTDNNHHVVMLDGHDRGMAWPGWGLDQPTAAVMQRIGKKAAGRDLEGRTWDDFPVRKEARL